MNHKRIPNLTLTAALAVIIGCVVLPWLSLTLFNTKGEPREAIVALSMLQQDDWVLPVSCGGDIPYKPPMLAWCIAALSWLFNGGVVSEWTARMPSALALTVMLTACFRFFSRRGSMAVAFASSLVTLTSFEVYRAGMGCRVDMLNTMFIVSAVLALYRWLVENRGSLRAWIPALTATLLMSGAFLTKGPVGVILPCLSLWVMQLLREPCRWWSCTWRLAMVSLLASLLPLLWYVAAAQRGGEQFIELVMEENFGRFTGTMSYDSHVNPWWYNIVTLVAGWLPWTLMLLLSLLSLHYRRPRAAHAASPARRVLAWLRSLDGPRLLSLTVVAVVFLFYCIPASKRSVYLLPVYPFIGWFIALYVRRQCTRGPRALRVFAGIIGALALLAPPLYMTVALTGGPLAGIRSALLDDMRAYDAGWWQCLTLGLSMSMGIITLSALWRHSAVVAMRRATAALLTIYITFGALYSPAVLNARSDRTLAETVTGIKPQGPIYSYASDRLMRYYTAGFYTGDRVRRIDIDLAHGVALPATGLLIMPERDIEAFDDWNDAQPHPLRLRLLHTTGRRSCDFRSPTLLFEFSRSSDGDTGAGASSAYTMPGNK